MAVIKLSYQALSKEAFAPYGDVIEIKDAEHFSINAGTVERYHNLAAIDLGEDEAAIPLLSIVQCNIVTQLPFRIRLVERHPLGSQAFYPLFKGPMIVVVAPAGDTVEPASLQAFVFNTRQGVNFNRNTWHMPLICIEPQQQFMLIDRGGPGNNCELYHFDEGDELILENFKSQEFNPGL